MNNELFDTNKNGNFLDSCFKGNNCILIIVIGIVLLFCFCKKDEKKERNFVQDDFNV